MFFGLGILIGLSISLVIYDIGDILRYGYNSSSLTCSVSKLWLRSIGSGAILLFYFFLKLERLLSAIINKIETSKDSKKKGKMLIIRISLAIRGNPIPVLFVSVLMKQSKETIDSSIG